VLVEGLILNTLLIVSRRLRIEYFAQC